MKRKKTKTKQPSRLTQLIIRLLLFGLVLVAVYILLGPINIPWKKHLPPPGRTIENTVELQIALARLGFSPGSIDGAMGKQTRQALAAFEESRKLPVTGGLSPTLHEWLRIEEPTHAYVELTKKVTAKLIPKPSTWEERGQLDHFGYHSVLEMVAERTCADPDYIRSINPQVNWSTLRPGDRLLTPLVTGYRIGETIDSIQIDLQERQLRALDASGEILFHCPVSIARDVTKRPVGRLEVKVRVENPNYTFNPNILSTAAERENITRKFIIQPGPNNPVGTVWLGLNQPSYGIHGTPAPEKVGRTESSGCFRLANWNAETLLAATKVGTAVHVLP